MYAYLGKYKIIEIILEEDLKLLVRLIYLDGNKEEHLIRGFVNRDNAIKRVDDSMDKLKYFAKGTDLVRCYE